LQGVIDEHIKDKVHAEQIKIMQDSIPVLLFVNLMIGLALSYGFSDVVSPHVINVFIGLLLFMVLIRGGFYFYYKNKFNPNKLIPFKLSIILGSASAGIIWGAIGILYFPLTDQTYQLFLLMSLMAITGGSAFTYSIYLPGYFAYVPAILLPIAIQFFMLGDKFHITLGAVSTVYLVALTAFNIKINKNFKTTLGLRFENASLIKQFKEQKEEAERANKAKSKFLAAASHDLRQPLYALGLFTSVLDETIKYPKVKRVVEQINTSVAALTNLFDKLLDISQLDAGLITPKKIDFSLNNVFEKLSSQFSKQAHEKNIKMLWPTHYPAVNSEPDLLERILRNYLSNAIKYTREGQIEVVCQSRSGQVHIQISDTGIGISEEALEDIYDEFYQVSNPERDRQKGLGLGLSIVKRTADILRHEIHVTSKINEGSTFSIKIPQAQKLDQKKIENIDKAEPIQSMNKLVLIIDDEESIREGLSQILALWGYTMITAVDIDDAMQQIQLNHQIPDVIISDYRLRENKTGVDAIQTIKTKYGPNIPALLITGDVTEDRLVDMKKSEIQVLFKPVSTMKLRSFLRSIE
jgi:two-component system, sensor histidine kinase